MMLSALMTMLCQVRSHVWNIRVIGSDNTESVCQTTGRGPNKFAVDLGDILRNIGQGRTLFVPKLRRFGGCAPTSCSELTCLQEQVTSNILNEHI